MRKAEKSVTAPPPPNWTIKPSWKTWRELLVEDPGGARRCPDPVLPVQEISVRLIRKKAERVARLH
jgi:hypothetical protein